MAIHRLLEEGIMLRFLCPTLPAYWILLAFQHILCPVPLGLATPDQSWRWGVMLIKSAGAIVITMAARLYGCKAAWLAWLHFKR